MNAEYLKKIKNAICEAFYSPASASSKLDIVIEQIAMDQREACAKAIVPINIAYHGSWSSLEYEDLDRAIRNAEIE
jgi:hypothetical protein